MPFMSRLSKAYLLLGASLLVSCGGGGGSSTSSVSTPTPTPPVVGTTNTPPVAVASSPGSKVSIGGKFSVTAENSSDADGDNLTFTWTQTGGPTVLPGGTIRATTLVLRAPIVTQGTDLVFEVTASDGTDSNTDTVTVTAQPIAPAETVRPIAPINSDIAVLNGITREEGDQYSIYWTDGFSSGGNNTISSQIFSDDGTPVGDQRNGSFVLPQAGATFSTQINALIPLAVIENGGTIYSPLVYVFENAVSHIGSLVGPLEGNLSPVEDPFTELSSSRNFDATPIGTNNLLSAITQGDSIRSAVNVYTFTPDGSVEGAPAAYEEMATAGDPSATVSSVSHPAVTAIGSDGYMVAWRREDASQSPRARTIEAQIYTAENTLSGQTIIVDSSAGPEFSRASQLDAATFGNGNSLITWVESQNFADNGDFIDFVIRGRIVNSEGNFVSDEISVSESVNDQFVTRSLSLSNGDILVIWGEGDSILKARTVSFNESISSFGLGAEFDLSVNAQADVFSALQTETGRVIIGYNMLVGNSAVTSEIISFCPVGCE